MKQNKPYIGLLIAYLTLVIMLLPIHADGNKFAVITNANATNLKLQATLTGHTDNVIALAFSPDSKLLASGSVDKTARLWDIHDLSAVKPGAILQGHTAQVAIVGFSTDGKTLITGSYDNSVRFWDVQSGKQTAIQNDPAKDFTNLWNGFSPDMSSLFLGQDGDSVALWDVKNGKIADSVINTGKLTASIPKGPATFALDGKSLYIAKGQSNTIYQIPLQGDVQNLKPVLTGTDKAQYSGPIALSPDGATLAVVITNLDTGAVSMDVFDVKAGKLLQNITGGEVDLMTINLIFNHDGSLLVSSGNDGNALWDVKTGTNIGALPDKQILNPVFSTDGTLLAVGIPKLSATEGPKIEIYGVPAQ